MTTVISVENLSKSYRLGQIGSRTLTEDLNRWWARLRKQPDPYLKIGQADHGNQRGEYIWALKDVSFTVQQGEVLGIIGRNGAGKSTLLKILSRITAPTSGQIRVKGRIASLLEVGTGFHPELTGRENIYLNGAILGMSKQEVARKFDEIVDFAEIEQFMDTPVKRYSSGMYVRLAFAVAAHLEPEILVVDEVLAVGDAAFQKKCLGKMGDVAKKGRTVLFVSHNMAAIEALCHKGFVLSQGEITYAGSVEEVIRNYFQLHGVSESESGNLLSHPGRRQGYQPILQKVNLFSNDIETRTIQMGQELKISSVFSSEIPIPNVRFGIAIEDFLGRRILGFSPSFQAPHLILHPVSGGEFSLVIPCIRLLPGNYFLTLIIGSGGRDWDRVDQAVEFTVDASDVYKTGYAPKAGQAVFYQEADWYFQENPIRR
jgi:lipopolysaccharide transport system ATP-binding protein